MQFRSVEFSFSKTVLQSIQQVIPRKVRVQYNTIHILLSTPHGGFSETNINSTGNQKKKRIVNKQLLRNYMKSQIDYHKLLRNYLHINL